MQAMGIMNGIDKLVSGLTKRVKFYADGIGDREYLDGLPAYLREFDSGDLRPGDIVRGPEREEGGARIHEISFETPFPDSVHPASRRGRIQAVFPPEMSKDTPIVIHFAGTADETFTPRRLGLAQPLLKHGIASLILENPYYGERRPPGQIGPAVRTLSDQFRMNFATIIEGIAWLRQLHAEGYTRLGVTGVSMGGSMAASVAAWVDQEVACAPCLAPYGPGPAYLKGVLRDGIDWTALENTYAPAPGDSRSSFEYVSDVLAIPDLRGSDRPLPLRPDAVVMVGGSQDAYVLPESVEALHRHWAGSELRWVNAGHVTGVVLYHGEFRRAIRDSFERLARPVQA